MTVKRLSCWLMLRNRATETEFLSGQLFVFCPFFFHKLSCILLIVTCFFIAGCGDDVEPPPPVNFVSVDPPSGSTIAPDATITVTFDAAPGEVSVNPGTATTAGRTVIISGPFSAGSLNLGLTWADGFRVLNYTVSKPSSVNFVSVNPPSGSTIAPDATITVTFDAAPGKVAVSPGTATVAGQAVTLSGPFPVGSLSLNLTWTGGAQRLTYTVTKSKLPPAIFTAVNPPSGSTIEPDATITVTFDAVPGGVVVNSGTATVTGQIVTISGPFPAGLLSLNLTWADGLRVLNYTVTAPKPPPVIFVAVDPPSGSTIEPDATITVTFDAVPGGVVVNSGTATVTGQIVTISGPFPAGLLSLNLTWADGAHRLTYTVNPPLPEGMVLIPAGEFQMGSNDPEAQNDEQPVHTVYIDAFFMDETEVTNVEYQKFVRANPRWGKRSIDGAFHNGKYLDHWNGDNYPIGKENYPVVYVSWYAAMAYAQWVEKRLPTEAEWEYAARGGLRGQKYPWRGDVIDRGRANYADSGIGDTTAVRRYPPNGYGLYDMAGNVWEWCLDEYDGGFYDRSPRDNPLSGGPSVDWIISNFTGVKTSRVLRGGSWGNNPVNLRVAFRFRDAPAISNNGYGFRCARAQ